MFFSLTVYHKMLNIVHVAYSRTLFVYPVCYNLPLLTPNFQSNSLMPPLPASAPAGLFSISETVCFVNEFVSYFGVHIKGIASGLCFSF